MTQEKIDEILTRVEGLLTEGCDLAQVAKDVMNSYIFNTPYEYGHDEHYYIEEIYALVIQKYNELFVPVIEEQEEIITE